MTSMQSAQPRLDVDDPLLDGLLILCKLHGCPASRASLCSGLPLATQRLGPQLLPRAAADKVRERDASMIVLDHGQAAGTEPSAATSEDDAYYAQFKVPDDLIW